MDVNGTTKTASRYGRVFDGSGSQYGRVFNGSGSQYRVSLMVRDHDMGKSSMGWDDQVDNQIIVLLEDLQHPNMFIRIYDSHEFHSTPNGTPYWVLDVPENEKPKKGLFFDSYSDAYETYLAYSHKVRFNIRKGGFKRKNSQKTLAYFQCNRARKPRRSKEVNTLHEVDGEYGENSASKKRKRHSPTRAHRLKAGLVGGHDKRCVTFGAALLSDETTESFSWMLEEFLKTHKKQPPFAVTDQDGVLRKVVVKMFLDSHHCLCMWHITEKLPGKVVLNKTNGSVTCSCGHYNRHGFLCRHVFCVFRIYEIHKIPDVYLNRRWTKNVLPAYLLDKRHRYGPCIEETYSLASQDALYSDLLDVIVPDKVVIKTPKSIFRSKGTRRIKSATEKSKAKAIARSNRKVPFKRRTCSASGGKGHNKATCEVFNACGEPSHHKGICKKFPNQDKGGGSGKNVVVNDEDEGDTDDQFDDDALGATEDEFDEDDEVDEEYESDKE
nr:FAR1 DNA binding domain-containing protein [Tanacetum cinerariifolium]